MDASVRSRCLPGTRQELLLHILRWLTTPFPNQNVLWLHGVAGSGKSTMANTFAEYFFGRGLLGAFLFFDRNDTIQRDPRAVIRTLAYQLA